MIVFYKRDLNSVILVIVFMEKRPDKFKLLFKKYRRFKPLFQEKLKRETLFKY
jgi:hypothetical protein